MMMEAIETWVGEWADQFDQGWSEDALKEWVGKKIVARTPEGVEPPRGVTATIVGYSVDTVFANDLSVKRYSFITDQGVQVPLFTSMQVEEVSE